MANRKLPSGTGWLKVTTTAAIALSFGGILVTAFIGRPGDGGRGGALAVALTFAMLFLGRGTAERILKGQDAPKPPADPKGQAAELVHLRNVFEALFGWQRKEKRYLVVASVVSTLAWGFGDIAAALLCHCKQPG
jgi:hypothetical protein